MMGLLISITTRDTCNKLKSIENKEGLRRYLTKLSASFFIARPKRVNEQL